MKKLLPLLAVGASLIAVRAVAHDNGAPLNAADKTYLAQYEVVRAALAADKLNDTKKAAAKIVATLVTEPKNEANTKRVATNLEAAKNLAGASSLADAREAFKMPEPKGRAPQHRARGDRRHRLLCLRLPSYSGRGWEMGSGLDGNR